MNQWAVVLDSEGRGRRIDPAAACAVQPPSFVWIHLDGREEDAARWLEAHAALPGGVFQALVATETRPRAQPIGDGALVNLRGPAEDRQTSDRLASIRIWAEKGRTISVSFAALDGLPGLRERMERGALRDPGDLVAAIAVEITTRLDPTIAALGDLVDDCETSLDNGPNFATRRRIAGARSDAIAFRRFVAPQREALATLAALDVAWLEEEDRLHLRDAADRFARMAEELEAVRERAALIHEQLTDLRAEQIDNRSLLLSIVALIFLPLTFITGLLGMNVEGIPWAREPWAFWGVCAFCALVALAVGGWFAARHWFRR